MPALLACHFLLVNCVVPEAFSGDMANRTTEMMGTKTASGFDNEAPDRLRLAGFVERMTAHSPSLIQYL